MANVTLWGASYSDVPAIQVPKTGGGVAAFHDVSDTTAVASDVASGKLFHDANGALTAGTGSSTTVEPLSVTENGTYTAPTGTAYSPVTVNVSGGGGGISVDEMAAHTKPDGAITITVGPNAIKERAFNYTPITSATITSNRSIPGQCFAVCSQLSEIHSQSVEGMGGNQNFINCTSLTTIDLPNCQTLAGNAFQGCTALQVFDLPSLTSLSYSRCLYGCSNLTVIVLRSSSVIPIGNDTLTNTPFSGYGGKTGTLYVPSALIESYKTATNWSSKYNGGTMDIVAIEGSEYE